ncbi:hypothetical protein [Luteococcus japonicus]|uniref:Uncharacterized protein n=1 Tax=Luteococcus japonicus LSP_Lj1 TaxID=1255658 RepID=A0A1R4JT11_9ACTN|nr:hypothetical protein [Luteococcus japonicus]SJN35119.1 hypothetical protein FM114_09355 [Luteococcus japonicus LSP_Lj1]
MSASLIAKANAVTPAKVRRRVREQQLRGPKARPVRLTAPGGRPLQPMAPGGHGAPVELVWGSDARGRAARPVSGQVQLTDRGILAVVVLLGLIVVATVSVGVVRFLGVSDAPLEEAPTGGTAVVALRN